MRRTIEITVPVLNEQAALETQLRKVRQFVDENLSDLGQVTLIIADNGSTDSTPQIARALEADLEGVRYLRLHEKGVGRALKASWGQSQASIVGYMDLDLSTDLRHLRPALQRLCADEADIVTGSRLAKGARVVGRSVLRSITSRAFNMIVRAAFRISFTDGMCGFKFLKRSCVQDLRAAGADSDGWFFATEILVCGEHLGYRVQDLPVDWTDDPDSKVKIGKLAVEYLRGMHLLRRRLAERTKSA